MQRQFNVKEYKAFTKSLSAHIAGKPRSRSTSYIDDFDLLKNYLEVKYILKRVPLELEMGKHGRFARNNYRHHFGSYRNFLRIIGEPPTAVEHVERSLTRRRKRQEGPHVFTEPEQTGTGQGQTVLDYLRTFQRLRDTLGRVPTAEDLARETNMPAEEVKKLFVDLDKAAEF